MPRLRTVSTQQPGWTRVPHGRGFRYLDEHGQKLDAEDVARVKALVIPPAWRDVWISPHPNGHLQAVGTDGAGRRQYLYHEEWRRQRDAAKFDRVIEMATKLPRVRAQVREDLREAPTDRRTTLAAAVRLIDLGCFRLGSEESVEEHGSYGLTTLERRHVRRADDGYRFSFVGKSGVEHDIDVRDPDVCAVIEKLSGRRRGDARLLCHQVKRRWVPLDAHDVNEHIRELFGLEVTAKDFRTWHATVHVAAALGAASSTTAASGRKPTKTSRAKAVRAAVVSASELLGNTPTVCRSSYVDPRVLDLYESDVTIAPTLKRLSKDEEKARDQLDRAVVKLLTA